MSVKETPLERLLRSATTEVGLRPEFYKRLLESNVLVPVENPKPDQRGVIAAGSLIAIKCLIRVDGVSVVPLYSSPEALYDANPAGEKCVVITVRELFEGKLGMNFHLNPFSTYGREFVPHEVESLLATGTIGHSDSELMGDSEC